MAINLQKGARINLTKDAPGVSKVRFGLGWGKNPYDTGAQYDLDASVFILNDQGKLVSDDHFVFYNMPQSPEGGVKHDGDNRDGNAPGEDEQVHIDLSLLGYATEVSFIVTIHDAEGRKQNFGQIPGSVVNIYNELTGEKLASYTLEDDFSTETAVQVGSLYKKDGAWLFKAVGAGYKKGLADFVKIYGGTV